MEETGGKNGLRPSSPREMLLSAGHETESIVSTRSTFTQRYPPICSIYSHPSPLFFYYSIGEKGNIIQDNEKTTSTSAALSSSHKFLISRPWQSIDGGSYEGDISKDTQPQLPLSKPKPKSAANFIVSTGTSPTPPQTPVDNKVDQGKSGKVGIVPTKYFCFLCIYIHLFLWLIIFTILVNYIFFIGKNK
jgi:hypothetical protein